VKVLPVPREIENGVPDELTGAVKRDVASAFDLEHFHAASPDCIHREREARLARSPSKGDDGFVLDQEKEILRQVAGHPSAAEVPLELEDFAVRPQPEIDD
jgi:hypothetical protein